MPVQEVVFIGDEVTAAGFRLAGVPVFSPEPDALVSVVREQARNCALLLLTAEAEARLPKRLRDRLAEAERPLLAVVPDARGGAGAPDMEHPVRRILGIEAER